MARCLVGSFDPALGLGCVGMDGFDVERFEGAGELGQFAFPFGVVHPEDAVLVGIQGHRTTVLGQIDPQSLQVSPSGLGRHEVQHHQLAGGIVDEHDQGATWPASLKPVMWRAIDLHPFSRAGPAGAPLVNPGCFALLGLPQTLGDHPLSQRLDRQPVTVLLHQLLTGQRGAKVGVALMDQPHDLLPHGFGEGIARTPSQVPGNQPWRPFLAKADHQTLDLAYAQPKLHRGLPLP